MEHEFSVVSNSTGEIPLQQPTTDTSPRVMPLMSKRVATRINEHKERLRASKYSGGFIDWLDQQTREYRSLRGVANILRISRSSLAKIYHSLGIEVLTQSEASRRSITHLNNDLQFRQRSAEGSKKSLEILWQDPNFRKKQADGVKRNWQNSDFKERHAVATRNSLEKQKQNPDFRKKQAKAAAEGIRRARSNNVDSDVYFLPTIHGIRRDVGYAQSTWEANLHRILLYVGKDFLSHEPVMLKVPQDYQERYGLPSDTQLTVDFVTFNKRGGLTVYEIMAYSPNKQLKLARIELLIKQHPELQVRLITPSYYARLRRHFEDMVNNNPALCGWEKMDDNLKTNPHKYSPSVI